MTASVPCSPDGPAAARGAARWGPWLTIAAAAAIWTWAQIRCVTHVVTSDPKLYLDLARTLAEAPAGSAEWRAALTQISPLWPGLLALAWRWAGSWAPYWLNWAIGLAWLPLWMAVMRRRFGTGGAACAAFAASFAWLLSAHPLEIDWLLHPYREMTTLLLLTAMWTTAPAEGGTPVRAAIAGAFGLAAVAAREPAIFLVAGLPLAMLFDRSALLRERAVRVLAFIAPFAAAAAAWWWTREWTGLGAWTGQLHGFRYELFELGKWRRWTGNLVDLGVMFIRGLGWIGVPATAIGLARATRGRTRDLWWWAIPAAAGLLFHAAYFAWPRYLTLVWLPATALAADGMLAVLGRVGARFGARWTHRLAAAVTVAALGAAAIADGADRDLTLGPRIPWREVRLALRQLESAGGRDGARVWVERGCRVAESFILHHTTARLAWPGDTNDLPPSLFLRPENPACFTAARVRRGGVRVEEFLRFHGRLSPVPGDDIVLGDGHYRLMAFRPWSLDMPSSATNHLDLPAKARVAWIDWRAAPVSRWRVEASAGDSAVVVARWEGCGNGLCPLVLPPSLRGRRVEFAATADGPLPDLLVTDVQRGDRSVAFPGGPDRRLSAARWLEPPWVLGGLDASHGAALVDSGVLCLPRPVGEGWSHMRARLVLLPVGGPTSGRVIAEAGPDVLADAAVRSGGATVDVALDRGAWPMDGRVRLRRTTQDVDGSFLRLHELRIEIE